MKTPRGKYTRINKRNQRALGRCDYSGFLCRREDLVKQMKLEGTGLIWTGYWVHPDFLDELNPQGLTPIIRPDPTPIREPRPDLDFAELPS